ncbi:MAG TPA: DUF3084 domain-containing protein, partial [Candidatus Baltobacteraceae bacterium]|nr:DUF3084 domain-containing protein [Candidatus Baltobacteraceae bacterium]
MFVDFVRGVLTVFFIMVVAGAIAYVGDRVGHQVGRKRLTLFGIRPRYTSTIVAIGTGMLIAFIVTMIAILASQEVKTAFFRLNQINAEIADLQTQRKQLESKVNNGHLVMPVDSLMVPFFGNLIKNDSIDDRQKRVMAYYNEVVGFINSTYTGSPYNLKRYVSPPTIDKILRQEYVKPELTTALMESNVLMMVTSDQNLYANDDIHFQLQFISDTRRFAKGENIAGLRIPAHSNVNVNLAVNELQQIVTNVAHANGRGNLPGFLATNVQILQTFPAPAQMQAALGKGTGDYILAAYAAEDVYPHTGGIPIAVVLT